MTTTTRPQTKTPRRYETLAAAAERTGMSTRTLRRRIADGSLPAYRTGPRIVRVSPEEVDQLMQRIPQSGRIRSQRDPVSCWVCSCLHPGGDSSVWTPGECGPRAALFRLLSTSILVDRYNHNHLGG